jgi:hypothetical protein
MGSNRLRGTDGATVKMKKQESARILSLWPITGLILGRASKTMTLNDLDTTIIELKRVWVKTVGETALLGKQ